MHALDSETNIRAFLSHYAWLLLAACILFADQISKSVVRKAMPLGESILILPFLSVVRRSNTGAGFSILTGQNTFLAVIALLALIAVSFVIPSLDIREKIFAGLFLGGIMGNLVDRILYGHVTDFVLLHWRSFSWPAFNIADAALTTAVLAAFLQELCTKRYSTGNRKRN